MTRAAPLPKKKKKKSITRFNQTSCIWNGLFNLSSPSTNLRASNQEMRNPHSATGHELGWSMTAKEVTLEKKQPKEIRESPKTKGKKKGFISWWFHPPHGSCLSLFSHYHSISKKIHSRRHTMNTCSTFIFISFILESVFFLFPAHIDKRLESPGRDPWRKL